MQSLTLKQQRTLDFIKNYRNKNGHSPITEEIQTELGVKSLRSVTQFLDSLEDKGLIRRDRFKHRGIFPIENKSSSSLGITQIPVIASAGCDNMQVFASEKINEFLSVDSTISIQYKNAVAIKAVGNSMADAGINNGDYVLVEPTQDVRSGDRIVAIIDDMAVVKKLKYSQENRIVLEAEAKGYSPIIISTENFNIYGKVFDVIDGNSKEDEVYFVYEKDRSDLE